VEIPDDVAANLRARLHRVMGQVQAIERMLDEDRECRDIVLQVSAASKALEQVGFKLVAAGLMYCLESPDKAKQEGYDVDDFQKMFMRLS